MTPTEQIKSWISDRRAIREKASDGYWFFNKKYGVHTLLIPTLDPHIIASEVKKDDGRFIQDSRNQSERWEKLVLQLLEALESPICDCYVHEQKHRSVCEVSRNNQAISRAAEMLKDSP